MTRVVIGIDTSAYTTSICATDYDSKEILFEKRILLDVSQGEIGLRQNMAVFQHMKNLPSFIEELFLTIPKQYINGIAVSNRPRPVEDSYMPVFFAGHTYARVLSASLGIPIYLFSHQEGHIAAGTGTLSEPIQSKNFIVIHISGGTTEVCFVKQEKDGYSIQLVGGTLDLHAGQFVDRIGVKMGFDFPAGKQLEEKAAESEQRIFIPSCVRGYNCSFSGPATMAERLLDKGTPEVEVARAVEHCIAKTIDKILRKCKQEHGMEDALIVGGVASNAYVRAYVRERFQHPAMKMNLYFAETKYSSDNAYGISLLGIQKITKSKE